MGLRQAVEVASGVDAFYLSALGKIDARLLGSEQGVEACVEETVVAVGGTRADEVVIAAAWVVIASPDGDTTYQAAPKDGQPVSPMARDPRFADDPPIRTGLRRFGPGAW